ncbi:hydroxypyruvate isomerase family protein [Mucilaginibacter sp. AW1-7]|jgi:hydroxypyruvate isomerase|uniref:hydroxypyruvate isomerase family protein n=1 Tax=unclassified Mucilaginibacter TaxID=2617802 RepID=UPI0008B95F13|nr:MULTISPECIES: TIM barrel protein [unclassified Mucilaginibacter]WDF80227.1 TIM barrel protein [Mucilaginibacter sp. KACC 22773]SEP33687.1 hydroxypyruvate isomerase [Mucilaginibacter sp. OK283]
MESNQNRRSAIKNIVTGTAAITAAGMLSSFKPGEKEMVVDTALKGNINHAVCRWCYGDMTVEQLCAAAKDIGIKGIDLVGPADWPTLKKYGLYSSMCNGAEINLTDGFGDTQFHAQLHKNYSEMIPKVAAAGYKNLICFSGSRRGKDNETGWNNCVEGLKPMVELAEKHNIVLVMELLNSKIDHKDYQCDRVEWGAELAKRIGSEHFKLLFDIYHMQIDEGDVIRNIRQYHPYINHYHTGGVPGRNEIDETQELYYPAIMKAIVETGHKGFVAQEFIPKQKDKVASLRKAVHICDV